MINCQQLRDLIVIPVLKSLNLFSDAAVALILGTAAQETHMGDYLVQTNLPVGKGGLGIYQIEEVTYNRIWDEEIQKNPERKNTIVKILGYIDKPSPERLISDLALSTVIVRLYYYQINDPLPSYKDIVGLAKYYKKYYNTEKGKATLREFIINYHEYVCDLHSLLHQH
jgi:hypothetical protein